jgi:endogenous inhibitor of DNA gyrase (YacG/DUF329 family)
VEVVRTTKRRRRKMISKCPGRDGRNVTADEMKCPHCGATVELFSDEQRRRCPVCGKGVTREAVPSCAAWCAHALECLGAERLEEMRLAGALDTGADTANEGPCDADTDDAEPAATEVAADPS